MVTDIVRRQQQQQRHHMPLSFTHSGTHKYYSEGGPSFCINSRNRRYRNDITAFMCSDAFHIPSAHLQLVKGNIKGNSNRLRGKFNDLFIIRSLWQFGLSFSYISTVMAYWDEDIYVRRFILTFIIE